MSRLKCHVLSHQQGVNRLQVTNAAVHVTKSSVISFAEFPSPQILTKTLNIFLYPYFEEVHFYLQILDTSTVPFGDLSHIYAVVFGQGLLFLYFELKRSGSNEVLNS